MEALGPVSLPLDLMRTANLDEGARRHKALQELEGIFLHLLLKEMRKSVPQGGLLGDSPAQKMFTEMLDEVYAQQMAKSGQLGLAKAMGNQIDAQAKQREVREALAAGPTALLPLHSGSGSPALLDFPQVGPRGAFIPVKSPRDGADMFSVDGLD